MKSDKSYIIFKREKIVTKKSISQYNKFNEVIKENGYYISKFKKQ